MHNHDDLHDQDEPLSKTAVKKEMTALQDLGADIVKLTDGQLATIPLEGKLKEAIETARRIKHREGLRRQMQYIGKLMRLVDVEPIRHAYEQLLNGRKEQAREFHKLEQWRDRLIEEGDDAIEELLNLYPNAERQTLRQMVRNAQKERKQEKPPAAARKLFRYLRDSAGL